MRGTVANMATLTAAYRNRTNNFIQHIESRYFVSMADHYAAAWDGVVKRKGEVEQGVTLGDALDRLEE